MRPVFPRGRKTAQDEGMMAMRNAISGGSRRTHRAERQALVSSLAVACAFVFVTAVVFGLI